MTQQKTYWLSLWFVYLDLIRLVSSHKWQACRCYSDRAVEHVNSAHAHCVKCREVTVKKKRVETFRKIYGMVTVVYILLLLLGERERAHLVLQLARAVCIIILGECWTLLASGSEARY